MNTETSEGALERKYEKCLRPGCENLEEARGLCNSCYAAALRYVRLGKVTWEQLEKEGKSKPRRTAVISKWFKGE